MIIIIILSYLRCWLWTNDQHTGPAPCQETGPECPFPPLLHVLKFYKESENYYLVYKYRPTFLMERTIWIIHMFKLTLNKRTEVWIEFGLLTTDIAQFQYTKISLWPVGCTAVLPVQCSCTWQNAAIYWPYTSFQYKSRLHVHQILFNIILLCRNNLESF